MTHDNDNPVLIYEEADKPVEVRLDADQDTVWLSQRQMGGLFDTTPEDVLMHLKNIFKDEELAEEATTKDFLVVRQEGQRQVRRRVKHYNLGVDIRGQSKNSKDCTLTPFYS